MIHILAVYRQKKWHTKKFYIHLRQYVSCIEWIYEVIFITYCFYSDAMNISWIDS